jgi:hypothetical protein
MTSPKTLSRSAPREGNEEGSSPRRAHAKGVLLSVVLGSATLATVAGAEFLRGSPERSLVVQTACTLVALLWVGVASREGWRNQQPLRLAPVDVLAGFALVAVACVLRYRMLAYLPLPDRTGFEELQMGGDGYNVLTSWVVPLEFRFSKLLAAAGLACGGETVEALRLPFQLMGFGRLLAVALCARALGVGWWPTAFVTLTTAVSRWFVIGGGVAYEDFSPGLFLLLLVLCMIKVDVARGSAAAWAAGAGIFAGILMYENSSFRFAIVLGVGWILWLALSEGRRSLRRGWARWRPLAFFLATLGLVATPMLLDVVHHGTKSVFFEAVARYAGGRSSLLAPVALDSLGNSIATLAGWPVRISFFLAPDFDYAVHPLVGALFILAAVAGLVRPWRPIVRALVLAVIVGVVVCAVTTNHFEAARLAPLASLLVLAVGAFLEATTVTVRRFFSRVLTRAESAAGSGSVGGGRVAVIAAVGIAVVYFVLSLFVVQASAARVGAMAGNRDVWNEYLNNQYVTASYLARGARQGSRVLVVTPGIEREWSQHSIAYWVYAKKRLKVEGVQELPRREAIPGGTLVVMAAEGRALRAAEVGQLRVLADDTGSLDTFDVYRGRGERILVASICVGCGERAAVTGGS